MEINKYRKVASKWLKTEALLRNKMIAQHIPETRKFNQENLNSMVKKYGRVVLKPVIGSGGNGIIFIEKEGKNYIIRSSSQTKKSKDLAKLNSHINRIRGTKKYLIQLGIKLLKVNGRPIDFRIRNEKPGNTWKITRSIGRVARKGLLVTNLSKGGDKLSLEQGLKKALGKENVSFEKKAMIKLTNVGTKMMETRFPGIRRLGFDFGIDNKGDIWIFEVNTRPS